MMIMTKTTISPPKMAGVVLLPAVFMHMGVSGAGVVGQLQAEGCWVTATPVKKNKIGHFNTMAKNL